MIPLTEQQIRNIWVEHGCDGEDAEGFARAIEAAHGISMTEADASEAWMETVAWSYVPSDVWGDVVLTDDQEKALVATEAGRTVHDLVRRTDATRLLAESQAHNAKLEAQVERLREALNWISTVNAMDYQYVAVARAALKP